MAALTVIETAVKPAASRPALWADALTKLCGRLNTDTFGADTLDGRIAFGSIGRIKLCHIEASRHRVGLSPSLAKVAKHPVIKVVFQLQGDAVYHQDGGSVTVSPGDCVAYDVSRPHLITNQSTTRHLVVIIPKDMALARGFELSNLAGQQFSAKSGTGRLAASLVQSVFEELPALAPGCEGDLAETLLNALRLPLSQGGEPLSSSQHLRRQVRGFILQNLRDPELSIDRIAAELRYSKRYLHMVFEAEGISIAEYIWSARLEHCRRDLECPASKEKSITDIAFSWGFSSSSHFSRSFKKHFGIAPSELRRAPSA